MLMVMAKPVILLELSIVRFPDDTVMVVGLFMVIISLLVSMSMLPAPSCLMA